VLPGRKLFFPALPVEYLCFRLNKALVLSESWMNATKIAGFGLEEVARLFSRIRKSWGFGGAVVRASTFHL
jgi:hypothetical protein